MKRSSEQPTSDLVLYAGIFLKTWHIAAAGTMIPQHAHAHDHLTLIVTGTIRAWRGDDLLGDYTAPAAIKIPAREKHRFLSLTDGAAFACIHAVGEAEDVLIHAEHTLELET